MNTLWPCEKCGTLFRLRNQTGHHCPKCAAPTKTNFPASPFRSNGAILLDERTRELIRAETRIRIQSQPCLILQALIRAKGGWVKTPLLAELIETKGNHPEVTVRTRICFLRKALRYLGAAGNPIIGVAASGYRLACDLRLAEQPEQITIGKQEQRLIKRLIEVCPSPTLAEMAQQAVFG